MEAARVCSAGERCRCVGVVNTGTDAVSFTTDSTTNAARVIGIRIAIQIQGASALANTR